MLVQSSEGDEHLILNATPGTEQVVRLSDGRELRTDGLVARAGASGLALAGGTFATLDTSRVEQARVSGTITMSLRGQDRGAHGAFVTEEPVPEPEALAGRHLIIRHGDGASRGWTIERVEPSYQGGSRVFVHEEPGFQVDSETGDAQYYQFPRTRHPGPHQFVVKPDRPISVDPERSRRLSGVRPGLSHSSPS